MWDTLELRREPMCEVAVEGLKDNEGMDEYGSKLINCCLVVRMV